MISEEAKIEKKIHAHQVLLEVYQYTHAFYMKLNSNMRCFTRLSLSKYSCNDIYIKKFSLEADQFTHATTFT